MADDFYKLYCEEVEKNEKLVKENKYLKGRVRSLKPARLFDGESG
ncbi:MAG: hypothetical protein V8T10_07970 [Merdibacter sp.]